MGVEGNDNTTRTTVDQATTWASAYMAEVAAAGQAEAAAGQSGAGNGDGWKHMVSEAASSMGSGVVGTVGWALATRSGYGLAVKLAGTALLSATTKVGTKAAVESALDVQQSSVSAADLGWGVVDGFAGVAGAAVEARAARHFHQYLGRRILQMEVTPEMALATGRRAAENSITAKLATNTVRGLSGGAAAGLAWSMPHAVYENRTELNTLSGIGETVKDTAVGTALGAATGGIFSAGFTGIAKSRDIYGYTRAWMQGDNNVPRVDLLHFNDMHSALVGDGATLPQLAYKVDQLRNAAAAKGRTALVFDLGDNFSGNVVAGFTRDGYVEMKSIGMMGIDAAIPGNHNADAPLEHWIRNTLQINKELGELPHIASNIEIPSHPNFSGAQGEVYRPYRIAEMKMPDGTTERIGLVSLVTDELASAAETGQIVYHDAVEQAQRWVNHLRAPVSEGGEGLTKIIGLTHLGRNADVKLAQEVSGLSYIAGAHSHDAEPVMLWVANKATGQQVGIMQGGSSARWLVETNLAFKPDGSADRYRSFARLHPIQPGTPRHQEIGNFIDESLTAVNELEKNTVAASLHGPFPVDNIRGEAMQQTTLGTLVTNALSDGYTSFLAGLNAQRAREGLGALPFTSRVLKHTGDIRAGLGSGTQTMRTLSDVFLLTGTPERELNELAVVSMSGADLKRVLNFAVADMPAPTPGPNGLWERTASTVRSLFGDQHSYVYADYSGNFIQTAGVKYSVDMTRPVGNRISNVRIFDDATGQWTTPVDDHKYDFLTLFHPLEKWGKNGVFGQSIADGGNAAAREYLNAQPVRLSQVQLLRRHIENLGQVDPENFVSDNITNLTPRTIESDVKPRLSAIAGLFGAQAQADSDR